MEKLGIALSGGGARGIAHMGVLQAFDDLGIEIDELSGTSSGAIAGAFYASGVAPRKVLEIIIKTKLYLFVRPAISMTGLLKMQKLQDLFSKHLPYHSFQELPKKLTINATDVKKGTTKFFHEGDLVSAILASCCMPVVFDPLVIDGVSYIDGGILNNLPIEPLQSTCTKIVGVHCNPVDPDFKLKNAKSLLERTFLLAIRNNTLHRQQQCDLFIEPPALGKYRGSDLDKASEMFQIGYSYVMSRRKGLLTLVNNK